MKTRKRSVRTGLGIALLWALLAVLWGSMNLPVSAGESTATPTPPLGGPVRPPDGPLTEGDPDVWSVDGVTFESLYPVGFRFVAHITSSAGPPVRARVVWSHAPGTQRSRTVEIDPQGELSVLWEATGADAVPPWVGVTYYWDVSDIQGNRLQTETFLAEYADESHDWIRTESDDVIVFTENLPAEMGRLTVDALAQQRPTFEAAFGDYLPYIPRVILFGERQAWLEWQITPSDPRAVGTTSDDWGGTVQIVTLGGNLEQLAYGTVPHEIAHLFQGVFTIMPAGSWFTEGNATFFELTQMYDYERSVRILAENGKLPVLLDGTGPGVTGQNGRRGYDVGYTFWKWLVDNYGLEGHRALIELTDSGIGRNQAIEQVTGLSTGEVESRWRVWLGASPVVPTLFPTPTLWTLPTMTPFGQ